MLGSANAKRTWRLRPILAAAGLLSLSAAAQAQVSYIAAAGRDANPCTVTAPCRTFQRGIDVTAGGGELRIVSSGDYGLGVIGKSLTVSGQDSTIIGAVQVNNAAAIVALRGLQLVAPQANGNVASLGIRIDAASAVHIERCTVEHFGIHGIQIGTANTKVYISDSVARDNGVTGLTVNTSGNSLVLTVDNSRFENNGRDGIYIEGGTATIIRTSVSGNQSNGIKLINDIATIAWTTSSQNGAAGFNFYRSIAVLESSRGQSNDVGLVSSPPAKVTLSNSTFTNNTSTGIQTNGALVRTRGNNTVAENGTDISGTLTPLPGT